MKTMTSTMTMTMTKTKTTALDKRAIEDLLTRIDSSLPGPGGRIVGFIASGAGEGTSTLARAFVSTCATQLRRRSLLLTLDLTQSAGDGVLQALAAGAPLAPLCRPLAEGGAAAALGTADGAGALWELLAKKGLWDQLREQFDDIVLDLPPPELARIGLPLAAQCDGVVVVLEAEKTRAPVAESLIASLRLVRARILGTVLNKRRFYLPARVYRWL
jgi:Flp pilus assembly CpaE family ATPase